jgi:hypothetical protein
MDMRPRETAPGTPKPTFTLCPTCGKMCLKGRTSEEGLRTAALGLPHVCVIDEEPV